MAEFCPSCGETLAANATICPFCGTTRALTKQVGLAEVSQVILTPSAPPPAPLALSSHPVIVIPAPTAPLPAAPLPAAPASSPRNPDNAFYLEFLGLIGFLGIGQIYAGRVPLGIVMMLLWLAFVGPITVGTLGIGYLCLLVPAALACYFSGRSARNYMRQQQGYQPTAPNGGQG